MVGKPMDRKKRTEEKGALDLIEEATQLLRLAPAKTLAFYYVGSLPFVLGFLFFWADLSRNPLAYKYVEPASLGAALLFIWMKCWQAVFTNRLMAAIQGVPPLKYNPARIYRLIVIQTFYQGAGLFLLPLAFVLALPFVWAFSFYQNILLFGAGEEPGLKKAAARALEQARVWPRSNHLIVSILFLFSLFVFLNLASAVYLAPNFLKTFLGLDTIFTRGGFSFLNTTFLSAICALTYLCLDPLTKTVYVLRCFYGSSLKTGRDLRVELAEIRKSKKSAAAVAALIGVLVCGLMAGRALAADDPPRPDRNLVSAREQERSVSPQKLEKSIQEVIKKREFTWRRPREKPPREEENPGMISGLLTWASEKIGQMADALGGWIKKFLRWLAKIMPRPNIPGGEGGQGWSGTVLILLYVLIAAAAVVLALFIYRSIKKRGKIQITQATPLASRPDLRDESVGAEDLPEDEWLTLAREKMAEGSFKLALRAFYLSTLAGLADRRMIILAKHKTNQEYQRELKRRAREHPEIPDVFSGQVLKFDRVWYGRHDPTRDEAVGFAESRELIIRLVEKDFPANGLPPAPPFDQ